MINKESCLSLLEDLYFKKKQAFEIAYLNGQPYEVLNQIFTEISELQTAINQKVTERNKEV